MSLATRPSAARSPVEIVREYSSQMFYEKKKNVAEALFGMSLAVCSYMVFTTFQEETAHLLPEVRQGISAIELKRALVGFVPLVTGVLGGFQTWIALTRLEELNDPSWKNSLEKACLQGRKVIDALKEAGWRGDHSMNNLTLSYLAPSFSQYSDGKPT